MRGVQFLDAALAPAPSETAGPAFLLHGNDYLLRHRWHIGGAVGDSTLSDSREGMDLTYKYRSDAVPSRKDWAKLDTTGVEASAPPTFGSKVKMQYTPNAAPKFALYKGSKDATDIVRMFGEAGVAPCTGTQRLSEWRKFLVNLPGGVKDAPGGVIEENPKIGANGVSVVQVEVALPKLHIRKWNHDFKHVSPSVILWFRRPLSGQGQVIGPAFTGELTWDRKWKKGDGKAGQHDLDTELQKNIDTHVFEKLLLFDQLVVNKLEGGGGGGVPMVGSGTKTAAIYQQMAERSQAGPPRGGI